jgi:radical SAM superfamily enzyme YgiQ (UPF0313 family)
VRIDLYHLHKGLNFSNVVHPIVMDVLKVWSEPRGWQARVSVCKEGEVDLDTDAEVVGISVYTVTAPIAYRISDELRRRGKIVILGGPHFRGSRTHEEAARHCDVIVGSICEEQWVELLSAIANGELSAFREKPLLITDRENRFRYPENFTEANRSLRWYQIPSVPASIGCPYDCDFCAAYMQGRYLLRGIETVRNEMERAPGRVAFLCDASFGLQKQFTIDLMHELAPLKKKIVIETTLARLRDRELLEAFAKGGVKWIMVGVETLTEKLRKHGSGGVEQSFVDVIARAHDLGILIQGMFICGMDQDGPDSFDRIYDYCSRSRLDAPIVGILTPYPDTAIYRRMERENRIIDRDWEHYDGHHVVFRPRRMNVDQLIEGYIDLHRRLQSRQSLRQELLGHIRTHGLGAEAAMMFGHGIYRRLDLSKKAKLLRTNVRRAAVLPALSV